MFDRIWSWILTILIFFFPSLNRYSPALDWKAATNTVLTAIQNRDIDTIESFMCKNIKDNTSDLRGEIGRLIDLIDGTITSKSTEFYDDFSVASGGKTIMQATANSQIYTTAGEYGFDIIWEYYNNFSFAERGIREIRLSIPLETGWYDILVRIKAT